VSCGVDVVSLLFGFIAVRRSLCRLLVGYLEFVVLLFLPGMALIELFRLGGDFSLAGRLGLAFGLSMGLDVLVLTFRTSGLLLGSQLMIGIFPVTLEIMLGASLVAFAAAGVVFFLLKPPVFPPASPGGEPTVRDWLNGVLVILFAYGGFEGALVPMSEAKDPRRDAPFALYAALATTTLLFCAIQVVVVAVLPTAAITDRPLAAAASQFWGRAGALLISAGALVSVTGYLSAQMLHVPRLTFALAERRDFPSFFARVHPRYRTPYVSILVVAAIVWTLAAVGNFKWNVLLSSVGRLFAYGSVCAALPVLRRKRPAAPAYRLPAGNFFAAAGVLFMLALASQMGRGEWAVILITMAVACVNWLWVRRRPAL